MTRSFSRLIPLAAAFALAGLASAQTTFNFDSILSGDTPTGGPTFASLLIEDLAPGQVKMTLTPSATADPSQFISRLFMNVDDAVTGLTLDSSNSFLQSFVFNSDSQNYGGGNYDLNLNFDIAPPSDRLLAGKTAEWIFSGSGLNSNSFSFAANNGSYSALHLQGLDMGGSVHVTAAPVPEPGTMLALGVGAALLAVRRRRQK
jgi:hypothetical protein